MQECNVPIELGCESPGNAPPLCISSSIWSNSYTQKGLHSLPDMVYIAVRLHSYCTKAVVVRKRLEVERHDAMIQESVDDGG